jgi:hypothetical protein
MLTRAMAIRVVLAKLGCAVCGERAGHHPGRRGEWPAYAGTYASKNDTFGVILDSCRGCKHLEMIGMADIVVGIEVNSDHFL